MSAANALTASLLIEIPKRFPNIRVWRQNSGGGVAMSTVKLAIDAMLSGNVSQAVSLLRRPIKFGILGGGDISGVIGPSGIRLEIEVKVKDKQSDEQLAFHSMIANAGAVYIVAHDVEKCLSDIAQQAL